MWLINNKLLSSSYTISDTAGMRPSTYEDGIKESSDDIHLVADIFEDIIFASFALFLCYRLFFNGKTINSFFNHYKMVRARNNIQQNSIRDAVLNNMSIISILLAKRPRMGGLLWRLCKRQFPFIEKEKDLTRLRNLGLTNEDNSLFPIVKQIICSTFVPKKYSILKPTTLKKARKFHRERAAKLREAKLNTRYGTTVAKKDETNIKLIVSSGGSDDNVNQSKQQQTKNPARCSQELVCNPNVTNDLERVDVIVNK